MTVIYIIRQTFFALTIIFIVTTILVLTVGQSIPIEFSNSKLRDGYYEFVFQALPLSIIITLIGTIQKKNTKSKNWKVGLLTVLTAALCFFILIRIMITIGFGSWTNEAILYRNKADKKITINQQIFDEGALGYGRHRTVMLTPILKSFQKVQEVDTSKIDKTKWLYVNEEGDLHFP